MESIKSLRKFWKGKKVFITGHTGFKGSWLSIMLNMLGADIYGYSLKPEKNSLFLKANCKKFLKRNIYSNINDRSKLEKEIIKSKPQIIFPRRNHPDLTTQMDIQGSHSISVGGGGFWAHAHPTHPPWPAQYTC